MRMMKIGAVTMFMIAQAALAKQHASRRSANMAVEDQLSDATGTQWQIVCPTRPTPHQRKHGTCVGTTPTQCRWGIRNTQTSIQTIKWICCKWFTTDEMACPFLSATIHVFINMFFWFNGPQHQQLEWQWQLDTERLCRTHKQVVGQVLTKAMLTCNFSLDGGGCLTSVWKTKKQGSHLIVATSRLLGWLSRLLLDFVWCLHKHYLRQLLWMHESRRRNPSESAWKDNCCRISPRHIEHLKCGYCFVPVK